MNKTLITFEILEKVQKQIENVNVNKFQGSLNNRIINNFEMAKD